MKSKRRWNTVLCGCPGVWMFNPPGETVGTLVVDAGCIIPAISYLRRCRVQLLGTSTACRPGGILIEIE